MNAQPGQNIILNKSELNRIILIQDIKGIAAMLLFLVNVLLWTPRGDGFNQSAITKNANDDAIYTTCRWPRSEGEMTVVAVLDGKRTCWRWK